MTYTPKPIDTTGVALPPDLLRLTERLAQNTHEIWARQRINDGWTWGAERNDAQKKTPCLLPYDQLPESEKEYDRVAVLGVLGAVVALGYRIEPPVPEG